jgi:hypothetical protein
MGTSVPTATAFPMSASLSNTDKIYKPHPIPSNAIEESVHKLLPAEENPPPKKAMYRSKFAEEARREYVMGQKQAASMGPAKVQLNKAEAFLRKGEVQRLPKKGKWDITLIVSEFFEFYHQTRHIHRTNDILTFLYIQVEKFIPDRSVRKAPVPKDAPTLVKPSKKDFVKSNALENINSGNIWL